MCLALPIEEDGKRIGILALTEPTTEVDQIVRRTRSVVTISLLLASFLAAAVCATMASRWSSRLTSMRDAVARLSSPHSGSTAPSRITVDEFGELSRTVDHVREELSRQIRGIDQVRRDLQSMLETIPEAVIAIDAEQRVLFANASTYRLFGLPPHDISGQKLWEILRQPGLQDAVSLTFAGQEQTSTEFEIRHPPRVLSFRGRSLTVGSGRGIIIVLHDVTELRRLEPHASGFLRQRLSRAQDPPRGDQGLHGNAARWRYRKGRSRRAIP